MKKARETASLVMQSEPGFRSEDFGRKLPFKDPAVRKRFIDTLKKAGFA
jgi:hypothetical protein